MDTQTIDDPQIVTARIMTSQQSRFVGRLSEKKQILTTQPPEGRWYYLRELQNASWKEILSLFLEEIFVLIKTILIFSFQQKLWKLETGECFHVDLFLPLFSVSVFAT